MENYISLQIKQYAAGQKQLFENLKLSFEKHKTTVILGGSGVGKSTLLKMLCGFIASNEIAISDEESQFCFQDVAYMAQEDLLLPWMTVLGNVLLGQILRGAVSAKSKENAIQLLNHVGLGSELKQNASSLSGGMRQRVALVRTLMEEKPIVLMDEPFSALDIAKRYELQNMSATLFKNKTVIMVTHDPKEALRLGHRVIVLKGQPAEVVCDISPAGDVPRSLTEKALLDGEREVIQALLGEEG